MTDARDAGGSVVNYHGRMAGNGPETDGGFNHHRRTAAILIGEGTAAAYVAGVMHALDRAGVRIDLVLGRGASAVVAALSAIEAEGRLEGDDGLLALIGRRGRWRLRTLYRVSVLCLTLSFAAFLSPLLVGLLALLVLPFVTIGRLVSGTSAEATPAWLGYLLEAGEPFYLRAMVVPLIALCAFWAAWWVVAVVRERRLPALPAIYDLAPLTSLLEAGLWHAARGASTEDRPSSRKELGEAYHALLSGSLGQRGFKELVFYALDTDSGQEVAFATLKDRFFKKLGERRPGRLERARAEPIDLGQEGGAVFFDALVGALSPPGLVPSVPIKLPLGTSHGGEVHRFSSSLFAGGSMVSDAIAAGAEQLIVIAGCASGDKPTGNAIERLTEATARRSLSNELDETARSPDKPTFLIRPDKARLRPYEISGRAQLGNDRLDLVTLAAHGRRDAARLFIEPVLGEGYELPDESTVPIKETSVPSAGPREL